jgi:hypothetical protein
LLDAFLAVAFQFATSSSPDADTRKQIVDVHFLTFQQQPRFSSDENVLRRTQVRPERKPSTSESISSTGSAVGGRLTFRLKLQSNRPEGCRATAIGSALLKK